MSTRNPTMVAKCGCPYDPDYDEGHLGWHLIENHPETFPRVEKYHHGDKWDKWVDCVGGEVGVHQFQVNAHFAPHLTGPTHMLVCGVCGMHLHADFKVANGAASGASAPPGL